MRHLVGRLCAGIGAGAWVLTGPLEGACPFPWLDMGDLNVCKGGRMVCRAVQVAGKFTFAVNGDGQREVRGVATRVSEAEPLPTEVLRSRGGDDERDPLRGNLSRTRGAVEHLGGLGAFAATLRARPPFIPAREAAQAERAEGRLPRHLAPHPVRRADGAGVRASRRATFRAGGSHALAPGGDAILRFGSHPALPVARHDVRIIGNPEVGPRVLAA